MFVTKSRFADMESRAVNAEARARYATQEYNKLNGRWNALVGRINRLGGEDFLKGSEQKQSAQFSAEDIQRLIQLCHPDKHDGKRIATEMTAKLLKMRESIA